MRIDIATLFPVMCRTVMDESIIGRAQRAGYIEVNCHNIRDYAGNKHNRVDDNLYGGGKGMVMEPGPLYACCTEICNQLGKRPKIIYMSPQGEVFTQKKAIELSKEENILLVCGHYEGVDQRFIDEMVDEELSIGDYVLTGGELGALVVADAVSRLCEGVLADPACFMEESHYGGLLEHPHYTHPAAWHDREVPPVLLSGHHANIIRWRREKALENTLHKRPDMLLKAPLTAGDKKYLIALLQKKDEDDGV